MNLGTPSRDGCRECTTLLGAFIDGALDTATTLAVDEHLSRCEHCRERVELDRAVRGSLKKTSQEVKASDAMRARMMAAMAQAGAAAKSAPEADSSETAEKEAPNATAIRAFSSKSTAKLVSWRTMIPLASAAAMALMWTSVSQVAPHSSHSSDVMRAGFDPPHDPLADLVAQHSRPLPSDTTDVKDVRGLSRWVGVPVRPPVLRGEHTRFIGGRVMTVHQERAAMLQYEVGQGSSMQRVSVFIYDPHKIQVGRDELTPRAIGTAEVRVGHADGYSVAVRGGGDTGVGYTVVSDLDPERSVELVAFSDDD